jgi:hypothetical protein
MSKLRYKQFLGKYILPIIIHWRTQYVTVIAEHRPIKQKFSSVAVISNVNVLRKTVDVQNVL